MTDSEIVKALKELFEVMLYEGDLQRASTISHTIDHIKRQKEEIERFNKQTLSIIVHLKKARKQLKSARADSIKEFAERLKEKSIEIDSRYDWAVEEYKIDDLVKELVGDGV